MPKKPAKKPAKKSAKKAVKKAVSKVKSAVKKEPISVSVVAKAMEKKKAIAGKEGKLVGAITHYFSHIGVCVIKLDGTLEEGETIRIVGGEETDFTQSVNSMQIDHEKVKVAKKGDSVGLKIKDKAREGYKVFKI